MSKKKKRLLHKTGRRYDERLSSKSNQLSLLKERNEELEELFRKSQDALSIALGGEAIEQLLKNEAYAFMGSRSKHQAALYKLTMEANLGGIWIDDI